MFIPRSVFAVAHCGDAGSGRFALGGLKLERHGNKSWPTAVATDGQKMAVVQFNELSPAGYPPMDGIDATQLEHYEVLLDAKTCGDAAKLCANKKRRRNFDPRYNMGGVDKYVVLDEKNTNGTVPIGATDLENTGIMKPQALMGRFPKWRDAVPKYDATNSQSVKVDARHLIELLQTLLASGAGRQTDGAAVTITIAKDVYADDEITGEKVIVGAGDARAVLITCNNGEDGFEHLRGVGIIMPLSARRDDATEIKPVLPVWQLGIDEEPLIEPPPPPAKEEVPKEDEEDEDDDWETEDDFDDDPDTDELGVRSVNPDNFTCKKCKGVFNRSFSICYQYGGGWICESCNKELADKMVEKAKENQLDKKELAKAKKQQREGWNATCAEILREKATGISLASAYIHKQVEEFDDAKRAEATAQVEEYIKSQPVREAIKKASTSADAVACQSCGKMVRKIFLTNKKGKMVCPDC